MGMDFAVVSVWLFRLCRESLNRDNSLRVWSDVSFSVTSDSSSETTKRPETY